MALHGIAAVSPIWEMANPSSPLPLQQIPPPLTLPRTFSSFFHWITREEWDSGNPAGTDDVKKIRSHRQREWGIATCR